MVTSKKQSLYFFLCGIFITNAIVAEVIGTKIFSVEQTLGLSPAQIEILGYKLDFNMSAGVLNWPIVFIVSDIINEYYGVRGVKMVSYFTTVLIAYTFFLLYGSSGLKPAQFWIDINSKDIEGNAMNINTAYSSIVRQGLGIIIGSITAFLIGQLLDAYVFRRIRNLTSNRFLWLRATFSTLCSQLVDSFLVIFIAFYIFGNWPIEQILASGTVSCIYKFGVAILLTPLIYLVHNMIDKYLGKSYSNELINEATFH
ncbi:MAG: queuosine precursor transporter [Leadbetterella sp.]